MTLTAGGDDFVALPAAVPFPGRSLEPVAVAVAPCFAFRRILVFGFFLLAAVEDVAAVAAVAAAGSLVLVVVVVIAAAAVGIHEKRRIPALGETRLEGLAAAAVVAAAAVAAAAAVLVAAAA